MPPVTAILAGSLLWGLAWWPIKGLSLFGLTPLTTTLVGYGGAALLLWPGTIGRWRGWWLHRHPLAAIAVTGAIWNLGFVTAMAKGEAGRVVLLYYLSTGWAIVGGRLFLGESLPTRRWAGVLGAFCGACLILGGTGFGRGAIAVEDLLAIAAGIAHAATNLLFRFAERVPVQVKNTAMFTGTAVACVAVLVTGVAPVPSVTPVGWLLALAFGLWIMVADVLVQYGVSHLPVARSAVLTYPNFRSPSPAPPSSRVND